MAEIEYPDNPVNRFYVKARAKLLDSRAMRSKRIICATKETKVKVKEIFGVKEEKIKVIRCGISDDLEPKEMEYDTYRVGTLSTFVPRKRVELLIRAFKKVENPNAVLKIPSAGPLEGKLKKLAAGDGRIDFMGYLPEEEKCDYLNSLDVFVFPSKLEGYGVPIIEAMACGIPVVTMEDAIIPRSIKERTYAVRKSNLHEVLENKEWKCDTDSNLKFAELHNWERIVDKTVDVYRETLES